MEPLLQAILDDDRARVEALIAGACGLALRRVERARLYLETILHWIYVGDTALHLAAAGYRVEIVRRLLAAEADPNAAANHRRSGPLHLAMQNTGHGGNGATAAIDAQRQIIAAFLAAGVSPALRDGKGKTVRDCAKSD